MIVLYEGERCMAHNLGSPSSLLISERRLSHFVWDIWTDK